MAFRSASTSRPTDLALLFDCAMNTDAKQHCIVLYCSVLSPACKMMFEFQTLFCSRQGLSRMNT